MAWWLSEVSQMQARTLCGLIEHNIYRAIILISGSKRAQVVGMALQTRLVAAIRAIDVSTTGCTTR